MQKNLYDLLDITKEATAEEIKVAFRKLASLHHPDHNDGQDDGDFIELRAAYDILSDVEKRKRYDLTGYTGTDDIELYNSVYAFIREQINKLLSEKENIFHIDIIKHITTISTGLILVHKSNILKLLKEKNFIIRVNKKFKRKRPSASENMIYKIMIEKSAGIDQQINGLYEQIEVSECTVRIINEYEFDFMQFLVNEQKPEEAK